MGRAGQTDYIVAQPRRISAPFPESAPVVEPFLGGAVVEPQRVLVAGDVHGDTSHLHWLIKQARAKGCQAILQTGDFGFWLHRSDDARALKSVSRELEANDISIFFIEGNHDSYDSLWSYEHPLTDGWPTISPRVFFVPRGTRWTWQGRRFLGVGGGVSMDKAERLRAESKKQKPRSRWWPQEAITDAEVKGVIAQGGHADVLVAHDCPAPSTLDHTGAVGAKDDPETAAHRRRLSRIADSVSPRLIFHGHYHYRYDGSYRSETLGREVRVIGLGMNGQKEESFVVLDVKSLAIG